MDPKNNNPTPPTGIQLALRAGSEFFSGIFVGVLFGYGIDHFFGTQPWGMVVMILLGAAAGFRTIFKLFMFGQISSNAVDLNQRKDERKNHD